MVAQVSDGLAFRRAIVAQARSFEPIHGISIQGSRNSGMLLSHNRERQNTTEISPLGSV